jgi:hypothetical protein
MWFEHSGSQSITPSKISNKIFLKPVHYILYFNRDLARTFQVAVFYPNGLNLLTPLNAELNPIRHFLALAGAHHFVHLSRIRIRIHSLKDRAVLLSNVPNTVLLLLFHGKSYFERKPHNKQEMLEALFVAKLLVIWCRSGLIIHDNKGRLAIIWLKDTCINRSCTYFVGMSEN